MKSLKNIATFFSVAMFFFNAQAQQNIFVKAYEVPQAQFSPSFELVKTNDGGYLTGNTACLLKTDSLGNKQLMWYDTAYVGTAIYSIDKTYDGGFICTGSRKIIKLDSAANIIWIKQFNSLTTDVTTVRETPDYGFIFGSSVQIGSYVRAMLIKTDSVGNVQWANSYKTNVSNAFCFLQLTPDSGYLMSGMSTSLINGPASFDIFVMKIDSAGNSVWAKHYTVPGLDFTVRQIIATSDGNYVVCGGMGGQYLLKIDGTGNQLWMKQYYPQINAVAQSVQETSDKGLIVGGYPAFWVGLIMKTDSVGNLQWANGFNVATLFGGYVKLTPDGGYVFASRVIGPNGHAIAIVKTDSMGLTGGCIDLPETFTVTNVNDTIISIPVNDSMLSVTTSPVTFTTTNVGIVYDVCPTGIQNLQDITEFTLYPNPATTQITLQYNNTANATLQILDITGRRVKQMALSKVGTTTTIDVSDLPAGMYFYSVSTALDKSKTGKFVKE